MLHAEGVLGSIFSLSCGSARMGLSLGYNIHRCQVSIPCPQSVVWSTLPTSHMCKVSTYSTPCCASLWLFHEVHWVGTNHTPPSPSFLAWAWVCKVPSGPFSSCVELSLSGQCYLSETLLSLFDQSVRCPEWSKWPLLLPFCWPCCCALEVLAQWLGAFFGWIPLVWQAVPSKHLASSQTNSLTSLDIIWVMASHGPFLLTSAGVTWIPNLSGTVPACNHSPSRGMLPAVCLLLCLYPSRDFKHPGVSWHESVNLPLWERRELPSRSHWPGSLSKLLWQLWSPV